MNLFVVVSQYNTVGNPREWWVDTGASHHIFADKAMLSNYKETNEEQLFIEISQVQRLKDNGK